MNIFGEPIGTWISIAALLISFSTLLFSLRKQNYDERVSLAEYVSKIKKEIGEGIRTITELIDTITKLDKQRGETDELSTELKVEYSRTSNNLKVFQAELEDIYRKLGHKDPRVKDPMVLSALFVEIEGMKKTLEKSNTILDEGSKKLDTIFATSRGLNESNDKLAKEDNKPKE